MPVRHRLRFLTFPMRASRLCSLWSDMRPLRFRRVPFGRDVAFDPGGATASRITMPHILPSTVPSVSASAKLLLSWLKSPTPSDHCVRFASAVADDYATLASWRRATALPGPVFHRQDRGFERSVPRYQQFVASSWGRSTGARSSEQFGDLGEPIDLSGGVRGAATHRPDQAASHQGRAVGGASASRKQRFESVPLEHSESGAPMAL